MTCEIVCQCFVYLDRTLLALEGATEHIARGLYTAHRRQSVRRAAHSSSGLFHSSEDRWCVGKVIMK